MKNFDFIWLKDNGDKRLMHSKSDNIKLWLATNRWSCWKTSLITSS